MKRTTLGIAERNRKAEETQDTLISIIMTAQLLCIIKELKCSAEKLNEVMSRITSNDVVDMIMLHKGTNNESEDYAEFETFLRQMLNNVNISVPPYILESVSYKEETEKDEHP